MLAAPAADHLVRPEQRLSDHLSIVTLTCTAWSAGRQSPDTEWPAAPSETRPAPGPEHPDHDHSQNSVLISEPDLTEHHGRQLEVVPGHHEAPGAAEDGRQLGAQAEPGLVHRQHRELAGAQA